MKRLLGWLASTWAAWFLFALFAQSAHAQTAADYTHGVAVSGNTATIWFKPTSTTATTWADVHYRLNGGAQQNLRMTWNASTARHEQKVLSAVANGNVIGYWFTYNKGTPAYDTASFSHPVGGTSPTPTPAPTPTPTPTPGIDLPVGANVMTFKLVNGTNGAYPDSQVYWNIIGYNPANNALSWVDRNGNLVAASEADNDGPTHLSKNGQNYANYFHKMSDVSWVSIPRLISARMFISYGSPMFIKINRHANGGPVGFAGPDLANPTDPNANLYFEWIEFTLDQYGYHGNTTRVDQFGFPVRTRLIGKDGYDRELGELPGLTRAQIFNQYAASVPNEFKGLVQAPYRIVAPGKASAFQPGGTSGNYFAGYVDQVWATYTNQDLTFTSEAGTFVGRVIGNDFVFRKNGGPQLFIRGKPSTLAILEGSGNLASGSSDELVVQAQINAAFNRHLLLAVNPADWSNDGSYYPTGPANWYAKFWHGVSIDRLAYGFCYDDVRNKSTLLEHPNPKGMLITVGF